MVKYVRVKHTILLPELDFRGTRGLYDFGGRH